MPLHNVMKFVITLGFSCLNICWVPRMLFEHEADRSSFQHDLRDLASSNAMKLTCVMVILAYFTVPYSSQIRTENAAKTFLRWISLNKMESAVFVENILK